LFLADPVLRSPRPGQYPVIEEKVSAEDLFHPDLDGLLVPSLPALGKYHYRQVLAVPSEAGLSVPVTLGMRLEAYIGQPVWGIQEWTLELLRRLREDGKLNADDFHDDGRGHVVVPREKCQKVGRLLATHLAFSGEFTYSLNLRRRDANLDPT